jgi:hypothetical protein
LYSYFAVGSSWFRMASRRIGTCIRNKGTTRTVA